MLGAWSSRPAPPDPATVLALVLAVESVSAVAAAAVATAEPAPSAASEAAPARPETVVAPEAAATPLDEAAVLPGPAAPAGSVALRPVAPDADSPAGSTPAVRVTAPRRSTSASSAGVGHVRVHEVRPRASTRSGAHRVRATGASDGPASFSGPTTSGSRRSASTARCRAFPCNRSRPPDNYMYRWGCAGANNVYLLGHAYSVFSPLHDAYVGGRLRKGMEAVYADANGRVHRYTVRWWKLVRPTTSASWAWAPQSVPSMTLQTCVGRNSQYRLMVRLVEVGG